ncbi:hypothetical protein GA566_11290 [Cupriavidus sp. SW-Y-13]|nr:hypothetical protein [Cupriavidus sp. SW-Y-13]
MTRTPIRTTRTVGGNVAMASMTAMPEPSGKPTLPKAGSSGRESVRPIAGVARALEYRQRSPTFKRRGLRLNRTIHMPAYV